MTLEEQSKYSEFDIIEKDELRRIEEKEKRDREQIVSEAKDAKEERKQTKETGTMAV